ncbi:cupin domain-containing protein [Streptomyces fagopyri]|uniref:Cupin domain-containing protein n=1 Tax=Streptomyces fagopyri TaxID=2662397 RepID=A0A5Q0L638_9ACTN|nr:cupin domain-containing protein [Streptomyces fagopyri]QFZ72159.1 cupin domain-containing protein [Streptomyces fagopyri]
MKAIPTALVVQPGEAAGASLANGAFELLADGGAVSASRLTLTTGADGAPPHHHKLSHELFYVLDGTMLFRLGDTLTTVRKGGLVVIPPGLPHVFGAAEGESADVVVVLSPGIERFGYFEQLAAISRGEAEFASLLPEQNRYDVHFEDLPDWRTPSSR